MVHAVVKIYDRAGLLFFVIENIVQFKIVMNQSIRIAVCRKSTQFIFMAICSETAASGAWYSESTDIIQSKTSLCVHFFVFAA